MKAYSKESIEVTLVLSEKEALWLQAVMQNPLSNDPDPANEEPEQQECRIALFTALQKALE